jgi:phage terminase large subunit
LFRGFDDVFKLTSITVEKGVLCWCWIEECFELESEEEFRVLDETIRGTVPDGLWKQITLTFNPWVNSHWTKTRFFDNTDPDAFTLTTTYRCNEWLDDKDRNLIEITNIKEIDGKPNPQYNPERYRVIGLGEYGIPGGAYFGEFRTDIHVIQPFPIPSHWTRFVTIDYGLDMLAGVWIAIDERGFAYAYKEVNEPDLIISDAAQKVLKVNDGDPIRLYYAPPDLWNRRQESGKSVADWFRESGIYLFKSNNDREDGCLAMKEWLKPLDSKDIETGEPIKIAQLRIFSNCKTLINNLPQLRSDELKPNIYDNEAKSATRHLLTHAPDALRYFCVMRHRPTDPLPPNRKPDYFRDVYGYDDNDGEPSESYIYMKVTGRK